MPICLSVLLVVVIVAVIITPLVIILTNAILQYKKVKSVFIVRYAAHKKDAGQFDIFSDEELENLSYAAHEAFVPLTHKRIPDPTRRDICLTETKAAIYANQLRDLAAVWSVAVEMILILASALLGAVASELVRSTQLEQKFAWLFLLFLAISGVAIILRTRHIRQIRTAANQFRKLALEIHAASNDGRPHNGPNSAPPSGSNEAQPTRP